MQERRADEIVVLAPEGLDAETEAELGSDAKKLGDRLHVAPARASVAWAANVWRDPTTIRFQTLAEAANALRALGARWAFYPLSVPRPEALPNVRNVAIEFPAAAPTEPLGSWTLLEPNVVLASPTCSSAFPNGEVHFVEDRHGPPSRAYLKLWEALVRLGRHPAYGDRCIDLGSSPGGWTWAMQKLEAWVLSVDKAPLDPRIARLPRVECRRTSAFGLDPKSAGNLDWIVSDVICYPERLFAMLERWLVVHPQASYVVTIKFQGAAEMKPVHAFHEAHGGTLLHLHHNKHELTWMRLGEPKKRRRVTKRS